MAALQPFDPEAGCPKCCSEQVSATWHATAVALQPCWTTRLVIDRVTTEHLCRRCERCGYGWCEIPADGGAAAVDRRDPRG